MRAKGGVFRSALWREVMAAMLARPLHLVGDAEGTALGAAYDRLRAAVPELIGSLGTVADLFHPASGRDA